MVVRKRARSYTSCLPYHTFQQDCNPEGMVWWRRQEEARARLLPSILSKNRARHYRILCWVLWDIFIVQCFLDSLLAWREFYRGERVFLVSMGARFFSFNLFLTSKPSLV